MSEAYAFLDDPAEREFLIALDPKDVLANAHRWYEWVAQFGGYLGDSLIRELAFTKASEALGIDYDDIYTAWLDRVPLEVTT